MPKSRHPWHVALNVSARGLTTTPFPVTDQCLELTFECSNPYKPLGDSRFYAEVEAMTGQQREPRARGRPRRQNDKLTPSDAKQGDLPL